jgi:tetratricopeptide (TPR) repeat protein
VFKRNWLLSVFTIVSLSSVVAPVSGQALLPYTINLNSQELADQGIGLLQEAVQLVQFRQYQLAFPRAKLATQLAPNDYSTWFVLGTLYLQQENINEAITNLKRARSLEPREASIFFSLGNAYFQKQDYETAIKEIEAGLPLAENSPGVRDALFDLGNAHLMLKNYDLAIKNHDKSFRLDKSFWPAINNIGLVKYEQGNKEGAIKDWQESVKIDPEASEPMLAIAVALYIQGKEAESIELAEKALDIDGRYADLDFLKKNLWGDRLLSDTEKFFKLPQLQTTILRIQRQSQE